MSPVGHADVSRVPALVAMDVTILASEACAKSMAREIHVYVEKQLFEFALGYFAIHGLVVGGLKTSAP